MEKFNSYTVEKRQLLEKIEILKQRLNELKDFDIDCDDVLIKLKETVEAIDKDIISIVLIGAFSDGKTSVIAGWLGEECKNMKIDRDESSDRREIYHPTNIPDKCEIVDTPGLFGDKVGADENGDPLRLSDITKKYVDQANLILYVVEAKNPIKDSHKEVVKWILKDLHKLENTIFIINKMDSVVDVTDPEEYQRMSQIKIETLKNKIKELINISNDELNKLNIVTVSSDPGERGFQFWKEHREKYEERSHICDLEDRTNEIIAVQSSGLVTKTGYDVVCRVLNDKVAVVSEQLDLIVNEYIPRFEESIKRNREDINNTRNQIMKSRSKYETQILDYEHQLLSDLSASTPETINNFIIQQIGSDNGELGYRIEQRINIISEEFLASTSIQLNDLYKKLQADWDNRNEFLDSMMKKAAGGASAALKTVSNVPLSQMKSAVFAGRDLLSKLGVVIKFKPWGATKLASGLLKGLPLLGAGIDVLTNIFETWQQHKQQAKFIKAKDELQKFISGFFKGVIDQVTDDKKFLEKFAPQLLELEENLNDEVNQMNKFKEQKQKLLEWKEKASDIIAL